MVNGSRLIKERDEREGIKVAHFNPIGVVHLKAIEENEDKERLP